MAQLPPTSSSLRRRLHRRRKLSSSSSCPSPPRQATRHALLSQPISAYLYTQLAKPRISLRAPPPRKAAVLTRLTLFAGGREAEAGGGRENHAGEPEKDRGAAEKNGTPLCATLRFEIVHSKLPLATNLSLLLFFVS